MRNENQLEKKLAEYRRQKAERKKRKQVKERTIAIKGISNLTVFESSGEPYLAKELHGVLQAALILFEFPLPSFSFLLTFLANLISLDKIQYPKMINSYNGAEATRNRPTQLQVYRAGGYDVEKLKNKNLDMYRMYFGGMG